MLKNSLHPWKHIEIDKFLNKNHLSILEDYALKHKNKNLKDQSIYYQIDISSDGKIINSNFIDQDLGKEIYKEYVPKLLTILDKLSPKKFKLFNFCTIQFTVVGPNHEYYRHVDDPSKILSTVVYLHPENSTGTDLFKNGNDNSVKKSIEWKKNRAFIFSRESRKTWHSYKGNGIENRYTLVINLRTYKEREALLLEPFHWKKIILMDYIISNKMKFRIIKFFKKLSSILKVKSYL